MDEPRLFPAGDAGETLRLDRPLAFFDLETTGTDPQTDKIVEICILRVEPDGERTCRTDRVNPGRPIPPEATRIHGIRDQDVRDAPRFGQIAREIVDFLGDSDLAGFNIRRFDLPFLERELREAGADLGASKRRVVDVMTIFHRKEPRDLEGAVRFFLDREHEGAHGAEADVRATADVLTAQLARYDDLPRTVPELDEWLNPPGAADRSGKFLLRDGKPVFGFGKHRGRPLEQVARTAPDYLEWLLKQDFPDDARAIVEKALRSS